MSSIQLPTIGASAGRRKRVLTGARPLDGSGRRRPRRCGADRVRTDDPRLAKPMLSQLSYSPVAAGGLRPVAGGCSAPGPAAGCMLRAASPALPVGLGRLELPTSRLSGVRSNHLSYRPRRARSASPRSVVENRVAERSNDVTDQSFARARPTAETADRTLACSIERR